MNHLHQEKSPYLLQHLDNPVDWYPWGVQAFQRASAENRPIFLSIGYSTCHWCHVMAHESFEDEEVAALLNRDFVSIKVDREERPDIDQVYMEVCQRLTGSGGWPLTIIMTPDAQPFYAATYLPKHGRHGRPGMMDLLPWVAAKWQDDADFLLKAARQIVDEMQGNARSDSDRTVSLDLHAEAEQLLKKNYDKRFGGFGQAPKFPRPHDLVFLLQRHIISADQECLSMVEQSLQSMRNGGIYDQLGYGFHRYATDAKWLVPHFEKMLYDQAGLALAYLEAWQVTGKVSYAATVREITSYLLRDMISTEGGFYSAEDADSEGVEGKFYLWSEAEIRQLLGDQAELFCAACNVVASGNYHDELTGSVTGMNILHRSAGHAEGAAKTASAESFEACRRILLEARTKRPRPHLDDKIIAAWNGLTISALARAGRAFDEQELVAAARRAADFVLASMRDVNGRLFRRYRQGEAAVPAFAEDYAFLARGLLDLYATEFDSQRLGQAVELANLLRSFFQDPSCGRLFDTPTDGEELLVRPSSSFDGAMPSAGSVALEVFARLFLMTADSSWQVAADGLLASLGEVVPRYPAGYTQLLQGSNWLLRPTREVVIIGTRGEAATEAMLAAARRCVLQTVVLFKPLHDTETIENLAPFTMQMHASKDQATAYVCENFSCREPLTDVQELQSVLSRPAC